MTRHPTYRGTSATRASLPPGGGGMGWGGSPLTEGVTP